MIGRLVVLGLKAFGELPLDLISVLTSVVDFGVDFGIDFGFDFGC